MNKNDWIIISLNEACEILDNLREPINSKERQKRIAGKHVSELYPYYGATGQVGYIDDFRTDGEFVLLGEDGAPFFDYTKDTAYIINGKTWVNNHAHILRSYFNNKFLCMYLNQFDFNEYVSGTTRLKLTQGSLKKIPFSLPPLPEQRAIVAKIEQLFSDLDNGIANLKQAWEQLKVYRQAVLKKAFEGELTKEWREKQTNLPSAEELLEQIKNEREKHYAEQLESWKQAVSDWEAREKPGKKPAKPKKPKELPPLTKQELAELTQLPNGWQWGKLSEFLKEKLQNGYSGKPVKYQTNYKVFSLSATTSGVLNKSCFKYLDEDKLAKSDIWCEPDDILVQRGNTIEYVGIPAIYSAQPKEYIFPDLMIRVRVKKTYINIKYLYYQMSDQSRRNYLRENATGTAGTMPKINHSTLYSLPLSICPITEQEQIVSEIESRLSVCDNVETNIESALQQSEALRQSILKKAFEGKLLSESELAICRLEPDYEPAEKLLQRIKSEKEGK